MCFLGLFHRFELAFSRRELGGPVMKQVLFSVLTSLIVNIKNSIKIGQVVK